MGVYEFDCPRKSDSFLPYLAYNLDNVHVTLIYIPARSAGGGLAYNFTPQQWVDCLWTQRRGERRGVGEEKWKV